MEEDEKESELIVTVEEKDSNTVSLFKMFSSLGFILAWAHVLYSIGHLKTFLYTYLAVIGVGLGAWVVTFVFFFIITLLTGDGES